MFGVTGLMLASDIGVSGLTLDSDVGVSGLMLDSDVWRDWYGVGFISLG